MSVTSFGGVKSELGWMPEMTGPNCQYDEGCSRSSADAGHSSPAPRARTSTYDQPGKSKKSALIAACTPTLCPHCCGVACRSLYRVARTDTPGAQRSAMTIAALPLVERVIPGWTAI